MSEKKQKLMKEDIYYDYLVKDIIGNHNFNKTKDIIHHNTTDRFTHSLSVSYFAYRMAKVFGGDLRVVARSGLLHDFYYEIPEECEKKSDRVRLMAKDHPNIAVLNSQKEFGICPIEENAIRAHMYPFNSCMPKHKESWIVSIADKLVSIGEVSYRFKYSFNILVAFMINWLLR